MQKSRAVSLTSRSQIFSVSFQSFFLIIKEEAPEIMFLFFWSHYPWAFVTSSLKHPFHTFLHRRDKILSNVNAVSITHWRFI